MSSRQPSKPSPARLRAFAAEHQRARAALKAFARHRRTPQPPIAAIESLLDYVGGRFATHMAAEERELFAALVAAAPELGYALEPLRADHVELRDLTAALRARIASPARRAPDEQLGVLTRDLCDLLQLHLAREERTAHAWARTLPGQRARAASPRRTRGGTSTSRA